MKNFDVIIIGGSAAGLVSALSGKANYKDKSFLLIRKEKEALVPCGIPYIFGTLSSIDQNIMPLTGILNSKIEFKQSEVIEISKENKSVRTIDGEEFSYEKLILATGSTPIFPNWIKNKDLDNIFLIPKDKIYLNKVKEKLENLNTVVVIGAGFIGVEISDELKKMGKKVYLLEILPNILKKAFDAEIAKVAEEILLKRGVELKTNVVVKEILGKEKVEAVLLDNGEEIKTDAVILSVGYKPNTSLAKKAGLELNSFGGIKVDNYLRTIDENIFAVGDCAAKVDFITRKDVPIMLASTATSEARIAGMNLYNLSTIISFKGTIAIFSTLIGNTAFASAGISEEEAKENNFEIVVDKFEGMDKHPASLPNTNKQLVKLIVAKDSGSIIGGEIIGGESVGELINVIGLAIQNKMTITELYTIQIGTHPLLTSAPTKYPLIKVAEKIILAMKK